MKQKRGRLSVAMFGQKDHDRSGGVEVVVTELSTRLAALGCRVTCYNRSPGISRKKAHNYKSVLETYVPTFPGKGAAAVSSSLFAALACAFGSYDVVHIHAEGPAAMCWIPKLMGKKVVVTVHGLDWKRQKWTDGRGMGSKYIRWGERCLVKWADQIIVLSRDIQKYFHEIYGRETVLIPNGVNRPERRKANLIKTILGLTEPYVLYLARLVPEKQADLLIKAFRKIPKESNGFKLVIAGGSSDTDRYEAKLRSLAAGDDRILFTGFIRGEILEELYSNAYVYVLPSSLEGMPLSLMEAMSYGNCCLVSDIPECIEVAEDKAVLFRQGDVDDLQKKLEELVSHPEIVEQYRIQAADFICSKYDWDEVTRQTLEVYETGEDYRLTRR